MWPGTSTRRGQYTNVYLDKIEPAGPGRGRGAGGRQDRGQPDGAGEQPASRTDAQEAAWRTAAQEAAWRTAVEAAPWLVGKPHGTVSAEELYDKLKPFEDRVEADIEEGTSAEGTPDA
jgi:hypothetical protein